jgi:hypothetical protein
MCLSRQIRPTDHPAAQVADRAEQLRYGPTWGVQPPGGSVWKGCPPGGAGPAEPGATGGDGGGVGIASGGGKYGWAAPGAAETGGTATLGPGGGTA